MKSPLIQLGVAITILVGALVGYGFWYGAISSESAAVSGLQGQIDAKKEAVKRVAAAQAALTEIAGDEAAVQSYFVSESAVVSFIDDLQARGRALGTKVSVASVSASTLSSHPALSLALTIQGPFDALMRTVGSIEYAPYDLVISSLSITNDNTNVWHADVSLLVGSAPVSIPGMPASAPIASTTPGAASAASSTAPAAPPKPGSGKITPTAQ